MQISLAIRMASIARSFADSLACFANARAAASRVAAAGTDRADAIVGFDDVAVARKQKRSFGIGNDEQRFKVTKGAILAPFLCQLDRGLLQISGMFLKLAFKSLEERNRIGGGTRQNRR